MSIRNLRPTKPEIPADLAQTLTSQGIQVILELIRVAYFDLLETQNITSSMAENEITEEWFIRLLIQWRKTDLSIFPLHEKADNTKRKSKRGKPPTIDCCLRNKWHPRSYFGIECKLIEANDKNLCDNYINNGVQRFLDCSYSSKCSHSAMLGYIRQTTCQDVAGEIRKRLVNLPNTPSLDKSQQLLPFEEYYTSVHQRAACVTPFTLHHFLLLFNI